MTFTTINTVAAVIAFALTITPVEAAAKMPPKEHFKEAARPMPPKRWVYTTEMLEGRLRDAIQANKPEEAAKWAEALANLTVAMNQEQLSRANKAAAEMSARVMNIIKQAPVFIEGLKKAYPKDRELQANLSAVELLLKASTEVVDSKEVLDVLTGIQKAEEEQMRKWRESERHVMK